MAELYLITGCSGGGKSSLLAALGARGCAAVSEPGRRIVAEARAGDGAALPWVDAEAFARRALQMARADLAQVSGNGPVFFDRGVLDAAVALAHLTGASLEATLGAFPYSAPVFLAPPWREIFVNDPDRPHGFDEAVAEYARLAAALDRLAVPVVDLAKAPVAARCDAVLRAIGR